MNSYRKDPDFYRSLYKDILYGFSIIQYKGDGLYLKHLTELDFGHISQYSEEIRKTTKEKKILNREEKTKLLIEHKLWSPRDEAKIKVLRDDIQNKKYTADKLFVKSQRQQVLNQIGSFEEELLELQKEKEELLGFTAEDYINKKVNEEHIRFSLYDSPECDKKYFSEADFEELEQEELEELIVLNQLKLIDLHPDNIKRLATFPFFLNPFLAVNGDLFKFYGKPAIDLTFYQLEIYFVGAKYKSVLESGKSPQTDLSKDPQRAVDWYENKERQSKVDENKGGTEHGRQNKSIVGASKKEMEELITSGGERSVDLATAAKKKGGLSMQDLMDLEGA